MEGGEMKYLYHYTSIEKLALIMKTGTIKFTNLLNDFFDAAKY